MNQAESSSEFCPFLCHQRCTGARFCEKHGLSGPQSDRSEARGLPGGAALGLGGRAAGGAGDFVRSCKWLGNANFGHFCIILPQVQAGERSVKDMTASLFCRGNVDTSHHFLPIFHATTSPVLGLPCTLSSSHYPLSFERKHSFSLSSCAKDPEYNWRDLIRSDRSSNEERLRPANLLWESGRNQIVCPVQPPSVFCRQLGGRIINEKDSGSVECSSRSGTIWHSIKQNLHCSTSSFAAPFHSAKLSPGSSTTRPCAREENWGSRPGAAHHSLSQEGLMTGPNLSLS